MTPKSHREDAVPISRVVDAELRSSSGDLLGVVDELLIDLHSGRIEYVLASGLRGQRLRFHWSSISVRDGAFRVHGSQPQLVVNRDDKPKA
jgi:hypothetical protein